jgi:hypothetical protein
MNEELAELLSRELAEPGTSWSVGEFGALGEFHHEGEPTLHGGLRIESRGASLVLRPRDGLPVAYEAISGGEGQWMQGLVLCLPHSSAAMSGRRVITALGTDDDAARPQDRRDLLFDLGLGLSTVDFCVRTSQPSLIRRLHEAEGSSLSAGTELFDTLMREAPHRVLLSRLARLEIYSPIPAPGTRTPDGPHTHLLPHLLHRRRSHSANLPLPSGFLPCVYAYPAHPLVDAKGFARAFCKSSHSRFQQLLQRFGTQQHLAAKASVLEAAHTGRQPPPAASRHGRQAMRVALRQLRAQGAPVEWMTEAGFGIDA